VYKRQGAIRYDEWTGGEKAKAAGGNLFDLVTTILPGGALTKGVKSGELGAKASVIAKSAINSPKTFKDALSSPKTFMDSLNLTPERKASLADIPNVDIKGLGPIRNRQALTAIADLHGAFPEVPISDFSTKSIKDISGIWGKKYATNAMAYADSSSRSIVLNKSLLKVPGQLFGSVASGFTNGSFSKSNIFALIAHEFGHLHDFHDTQSVTMGDIALGFIKDYAKDKPELFTKDGQLSFGGVHKSYESKDLANTVIGALSRYSYKNNFPRSIKSLFQSDLKSAMPPGIAGRAFDSINLPEAKAEAFADAVMNGDKARPGSNIINDLVLSSIRKRKEHQQRLVDMGVDISGGLAPPIPGTRLSSLPSAMAKKGGESLEGDALGDFVRSLTPQEMANSLSQPGYVSDKIIEMAESGNLWGAGVSLPPIVDNAVKEAIARRGAAEAAAAADPLGAFMPGQSYLITPQEMAARGVSRPMDRKIYEELHRRIANPRVRPEISSAPRSGRLGGLRLGFGPADSYEAAAEYAKTIWPQAIEDIPVRASGSGLGGEAPGVEIPFTNEQFRTLRAYSKGSRVNKSLRGIQNLTGLRNILDELIRIRPDMSGPGGHIDEDFAVTKLFERNADTPLSIKNFSASDNWILDPHNPDKRFGIRDSIEMITENYRKYNKDLSTQQVWESIFTSYLREARGRLGSAIGDKKAIELIDASFNQVSTLPRDMWATRMVEPWGGDARLGEWTDPNPGFSSTSLGISRETELGGLQRAPVFSDRAIMQQLLLRRGTPALWFGGHERELLTPRGLQFMPEGMQQSGFTAYGRPGQELDPVTKMWGEAKFPETPPKIEIPGMNELDNLLMPLGQGGWSGRSRNPGWMDLLAPPVPGKERSAFNVPEVFDLGYASGGHVRGPGGPKSDTIPAMLSNGEFVMNADATKRIGIDRLMAMNHYADGGPVSPTGSADPDAFKDLRAIMSKPLITPAATGSSDPDAFKNLAGNTVGNAVGSALAPKGGASGMSASAPAPRAKDPRAILGRAPTSDEHTNPALSSGIRGAFNTIGAIAAQAAAAGGSLASMGATGGAPVPGAGQAASALVSEGFQIAGDVAAGAANIVSSFLVGTVTPSETGQGYGAPLLPQQPQGGGMNNFQSIHNGNIVTNNLSEYSRLKDRKDAQKAAPFFNRVNH